MKKKKIKNIVLTISVLLISLSVSIIFAEFFIRLFYDPRDFLRPKLIQHNVLGHIIEPSSLGYDSWGFRNEEEPDSANIIFIGDSHTFGDNVRSEDNWPSLIAKLSNQKVYNLSLGGYGPAEYYYLFTEKVMRLNCHSVVISFYVGNDFYDAYKSIYNNEYWSFLRNQQLKPCIEGGTDYIDVVKINENKQFLGGIRDFMVHHSVLYRILSFHFGRYFYYIETLITGVPNLPRISSNKKNIDTFFELRLNLKNPNSYKIKEGIRLTEDLFLMIKDSCVSKGIELFVLYIPTKEMIYSVLLSPEFSDINSELLENTDFKTSIEYENVLKNIFLDFLKKSEIKYADPSTILQDSLLFGINRLYPSNTDGHPIKAGCEIYARSLYDVMKFFMNNIDGKEGFSKID